MYVDFIKVYLVAQGTSDRCWEAMRGIDFSVVGVFKNPELDTIVIDSIRSLTIEIQHFQK